MVRIAVAAIQVTQLISELELVLPKAIHHNGFDLTQLGGPLVAEEMIEGSMQQDPFSYLVGVVSQGPKIWFVLLLFIFWHCVNSNVNNEISCTFI